MTRRAGLSREQSLAVSSDILKRHAERKEAQAKAAIAKQNAIDTGWRDAEQRAREHNVTCGTITTHKWTIENGQWVKLQYELTIGMSGMSDRKVMK